MEDTYALIMAGGVGSRFWPRSRKRLPKQYLKLVGKETLIQAVCNRLQVILPVDQIFVVSTQNQINLVKSQLKWLKPTNIIFEPFGKNTAPCIGLSTLFVDQLHPNSIMIVLPSDHLISDTEQFTKVLNDAVTLIRTTPNALATIGIEPTYPATGYGYIQRGAKIAHDNIIAHKVRTFAEKPTPEVAKQFFASGEFLWNSGIFIWRTQTILNYIAELMPDLYEGLGEIKKALKTTRLQKTIEKVYKQIHSESIDYGILERASNVIVLEGNFGWSDVGSWEEVYKISPKDNNQNVIVGDPILKDVNSTYVEIGDRIVALVGVKDLVVIDTPDALLICNRNQSQDVKWVVEKLKRSGHQKYL